MSTGADSVQSHSEQAVRVVLEVELPPGSYCPLGGFEGRIEEVRRQRVGDECHTDTMRVSGEERRSSGRSAPEIIHASTTVGSTCPCPVFGEFGCVPELVDVDGERLRIETYLADRERLTPLVDALRDVSDRVRIRELSRIDDGADGPGSDTVRVDLYELTEKQREAVTRAVAEGYYASPRETSIGALADEFEISTSALSQRLNAAESKLATAAFPRSKDGD